MWCEVRCDVIWNLTYRKGEPSCYQYSNDIMNVAEMLWRFYEDNMNRCEHMTSNTRTNHNIMPLYATGAIMFTATWAWLPDYFTHLDLLLLTSCSAFCQSECDTFFGPKCDAQCESNCVTFFYLHSHREWGNGMFSDGSHYASSTISDR